MEALNHNYTPKHDETEVIVKHVSCELAKNQVHHLLLVGVDLKEGDICDYLSWMRDLPHAAFVGGSNPSEKLGFDKPLKCLNSEVS